MAAEAGARQLSLSAGRRGARRLPGQLARRTQRAPAGGAERAVSGKCGDPARGSIFRPILPFTTRAVDLDLWPKLPAIARWLPVVLIAQFVLLLACARYAVRRYCCPSPALPTR